MTVGEKIEANADLVKWCVHVLGPDDIYAAPSHNAAVIHARELNKAVFSRTSTKSDILAFAYAAPWPHSDQEHTEDLQNWNN